MSSITYVGKRVAITGFLSVYFFRETVVRPTVQLRSDPKVSASLVVSEFCISTITLILAANYAARKFLSMNNGTFTGNNATGGIPTAPSPRPPAHLALAPNDYESSDNPCMIELPISSSPSNSFQQFSPFQSSSSVSTTRLLILDLPLNSKCNRLSINSDTTLVVHDDDILSDETSWIKDIKLSDDERTFHEEYATAHPMHAQDEHNVDTLPPSVPFHPFLSLVSTPLDLPTFTSDTTLVVHDNVLLSDEAEHTKAIELPGDAAEGTFHEVQAHPTLDPHEHDTLPPFFPFQSSSPVFQSTSLDLSIIVSTCNHEPACTTPDKHEHHGDFDILPATTTTIDIDYGPSPINTNLDTDLALPGPTNPTNALTQKLKATHLRSGQKFLPDKIRSARQQKRKPRASRLTTARDSIARSCHANKLVRHLVHICERIRVDHAALIDTWVAGMTEVGLSSLLTGHRETSPASPPSPIVDEVSAPEPGSRMKARLASLRQRTHAVAAAVPATTATATSSLSWQRTGSNALRHQKSRPYKLRVFLQQKRKPRASRLNAACDSIGRSRLQRHANRIIHHLTHVCERIRVDQSALLYSWVGGMADVGLTSRLTRHHPMSPVSPPPPRVDVFSVPEPGSRIKAHLASLRQRTHAVAAQSQPPPPPPPPHLHYSSNAFHHTISHPPASLWRTEAPPPSRDKSHRPRELKRTPRRRITTISRLSRHHD